MFFKQFLFLNPMEVKYTCDFKKTIHAILHKYSGIKLDLMISGGSILDCFDAVMVKELNTSLWSIFYSDERCSGYDLNYNKSLRFVNNTKAAVNPMKFENDTSAVINIYNESCKHIDLAILGIGEDGHVASIFPGSKHLDSDEYFIAINDSPKPPSERVTVTLKFLNECVDDLIFLIPPKLGKVKETRAPCDDIIKRLTRPFTVILDHSKKQGEIV